MDNDFMSNFFKGLGDLYSKEMGMEAIWFEKPIQTATERTVRITDGHKIRVEDGKVVDCAEDKPATHKVIGCSGTVTSSILNLILINLKTNQPTLLKVK